MIKLTRKATLSDGVLGEMTISGVKFYTLEPHPGNPVHEGHPCIPAGAYRFKLTDSPAFGYVCPELLDVPNRSKIRIRIHIGNFPKDSLGCILVGTSCPNPRKASIGGSKKAFDLMMAIIRKTGENSILIQ